MGWTQSALSKIRYYIKEWIQQVRILAHLYNDVFVFTTNPDEAVFQVSFTQVGFGQGDYVRVNTTINGQVYEWREPVNGIPQGRFCTSQDCSYTYQATTRHRRSKLSSSPKQDKVIC